MATTTKPIKMLHWPSYTGLKPRPYDEYDRLCVRYYHAHQSRDVTALRRVEPLLEPYSDRPLANGDEHYSHGQSISRHCVVRYSK
jgi:hypothetical protein